MIDLTTESAISLAEVASIIGVGNTGRPVHLSTIIRWIAKGARAPGGRRVQLEAIRVGSAWRTSREALQRFTAALTPNLEPTPMPRSPITGPWPRPGDAG